jgi:hypothetical protein
LAVHSKTGRDHQSRGGNSVTCSRWVVAAEFLQLRGVVNLLASRIDLAFLALSLIVIGLVLTIGWRRRRLLRIVIGIAIIFVTVGIDWLAPKPAATALSSNAVTRQHDQIQLAPEQLSTRDQVQVTIQQPHPAAKAELPKEIIAHPYDLSGER